MKEMRILSAILVALFCVTGRSAESSEGFEIRDASRELQASMTAIKWIEESGNDFDVYIGASRIVGPVDVVDAVATDECGQEYDSGKFGVWITLTDDAAKKLFNYSESHIGELIALVISGRAVQVARIEGALRSKRIRVCSRINSEARATELAKEALRTSPR